MNHGLAHVALSLCSLAALGASPAAFASDDKAELARRAQEILKSHCHRCHGQDGSNEGGFNFVLRVDKLARDSRYVIPEDPDGSYLLERIIDGDMPPKGKTPRPSDAEIDLLRRWIVSGAPAAQSDDDRPFITNNEIIRCILADLEQTPDRERRFIRYFTITHLYNAGFSDDEIQTYRLALLKLVNSLSWNKQLLQLKTIDPARTVFRVDMRDVKWGERVWNLILEAYPYGVALTTREAKTCYEYTQTTLPLVRGDWFVAAASQPPLYHAVLQLPETAEELERTLHVDVAENIRQETVIRAGFTRSGVSQNNRIIERHETAYGAYWRSYDFSASSGRRNIFRFPLGPSDHPNSFVADGGEMIFNLPNGLQGYMLVDADGKRIDKGPTAIVNDPKRPDKAVVNGVSCMSCHYAGIIKKTDEVRAQVEANRTAFPEAEEVLAIYPQKERMDLLMDEDAERFRAAVERLGMTISQTGEPVVNMALRFEDEIDLKLAAAEFGLKPEELAAGLKRVPELARVVGPVTLPGGTIKRDQLIDVFFDVVRELKLGLVVKAGEIDHTALAHESTTRAPGSAAAARKKMRPNEPVKNAAANNAKDQELAQILIDLKSSDLALRKKTAERMATMDPPKPPPRDIAAALEELVGVNDHFTRLAAIKALGSWGTRESLMILVRSLDHHDPFVRRAIIDALGQSGDSKAAEVVADRLVDFFDRGNARDALIKMDRAAELPVLRMLNHSDRHVRETAIDILKEIGTVRSIAPLQQLTRDRDAGIQVRAAAAVNSITLRLRAPKKK